LATAAKTAINTPTARAQTWPASTPKPASKTIMPRIRCVQPQAVKFQDTMEFGNTTMCP
jgi:hypothetical protein